MPKSSKCSLPSEFPTKILYTFFICPTCPTKSIHLILLDLIALTITSGTLLCTDGNVWLLERQHQWSTNINENNLVWPVSATGMPVFMSPTVPVRCNAPVLLHNSWSTTGMSRARPCDHL